MNTVMTKIFTASIYTCHKPLKEIFKNNAFRRTLRSANIQNSTTNFTAADNNRNYIDNLVPFNKDTDKEGTSNSLVLGNNESTEYFIDNLTAVDEDLSHITPYVSNSFNIAAYVNKSESLQSLVNLGVNLSAIEKKPYLVEKFLRLEFEKDMKPYILFLSDYVPAEEMGKYITKNPMIFYESLEDLQVRINYLQSKKFKDISRIIQKNPFWLMFSTLRIDKRLGFFQNKFNLNGDEVRSLAEKRPAIVTYNLNHIKTNSFVIKEEMGFDDNEIKSLILHIPKLWTINQLALITRFNYIHNVMKIPHSQILHSPQILLYREFIFRHRHLFLEKLGRAQYDPKQANYVPLMALAMGNDVEFCRTYAKCTVNDYNMFLKTL